MLSVIPTCIGDAIAIAPSEKRVIFHACAVFTPRVLHFSAFIIIVQVITYSLTPFYSHLRTRAGVHRGEKAAKQIARYVGKYLYFLNPSLVEEEALLDRGPVQACSIREEGIRLISPS